MPHRQIQKSKKPQQKLQANNEKTPYNLYGVFYIYMVF